MVIEFDHETCIDSINRLANCLHDPGWSEIDAEVLSAIEGLLYYANRQRKMAHKRQVSS